tara:strand:- start:207 stop:776 length:570 start_codon:yes stop_codon:yes gene_type:complete
MKVLNIGCGRNLREDSINVDITKYDGVDEVVDLSKFPWKWADNSVDGVHASHVLEHLPFDQQDKFILECHRILKKGGFMRLLLPHSSNVTSVGCYGHYRTFSYNTMHGYLAQDFYKFGKAKWKTIEQKLNWWFEKTDVQKELPEFMFLIISVVKPIINFLISISPRICENTWIYWIGGAREVVWTGEKL